MFFSMTCETNTYFQDPTDENIPKQILNIYIIIIVVIFISKLSIILITFLVPTCLYTIVIHLGDITSLI